MPKLTVHHLDHSQSFRIVWLLEEIKTINYELKLYSRNESDRLAPPEYKALSPMGTSPTITTEEGLVMNESNAIIEYILDLAEAAAASSSSSSSDQQQQQSLLRPSPTSPDRNSYLVWFHSVQGSMQPMLTVDIIFRRAVKKTPCVMSSVVNLVGGKVRDAIIMPRLSNLMEMAENQLKLTDYLAGNTFTAADITAIYPFHSIFSRYPDYSNLYPKTQQWLDRMIARPAYKAAQEKVGEEGGIVFENE